MTEPLRTILKTTHSNMREAQVNELHLRHMYNQMKEAKADFDTGKVTIGGFINRICSALTRCRLEEKLPQEP